MTFATIENINAFHDGDDNGFYRNLRRDMNFYFSQPKARPFHAAVVFIARLWILCRTGVSAQGKLLDDLSLYYFDELQ